MESSESEVHSFILKVWRAEEGGAIDRPAWRGHSTHVPSGGRRYVQHLEEITAFVASYLEQMGAHRDSSRA